MARASTLRASILVAMGIVPLACGGTTLSRGDGDDDGGSGGTAGSGKPSGTGGTASGTAGTKAIAGYPAAAGTGGTIAIHPTAAGGRASVGLCTGPHFDPATGLVSCLEGYSHRAQIVACQTFGGAASGSGGESGASPILCGDEPGVPQADCSRVPFGYCDSSDPFEDVCASGCETDHDCDPGAICVCGHPESPTGGVCLRSDCSTDLDCGAGLLCASFPGVCGNGGFACQVPLDECQTDRDCPEYGRCLVGGPEAHRICENVECGRPFLVDSVARLAGVTTTSAWGLTQAAAPRVEHLSPSERAALAEHWTRMGQMEHASIAAFARFSLQLLALGAPPELVNECTRALGDETAHTQLCFQLASAYAGRSIGPGPLDIGGSLGVVSLGEIVDLVIAEGCFGETVAALEALDAADCASDPVIAAAYTQIGRDEQRHAELAFRFLRWAMERDSHMVRTRVTSALDACFDSAGAARDVVVPCLLALLRANAQRSEAAA